MLQNCDLSQCSFYNSRNLNSKVMENQRILPLKSKAKSLTGRMVAKLTSKQFTLSPWGPFGSNKI